MQNYKHTALGWIPNDWDIKELDSIFDTYSTANYSKAEMDSEGVIGCLHYGLIHANNSTNIDLSKKIQYYSKNELEKFEYLKEGDLVMVDASEDKEGINKSVEVFNLLGRKFIAGLHTYLLRDNDGNTAQKFRGEILNSPTVKQQFKKLAVGVKVYGVSKSQFNSILIPLPPLHEQRLIADCLGTWDEAIDLAEKQVAAFELRKKYLMQVLLSGKKRLPGFTGDWKTVQLGDVIKKTQEKVAWDEDTKYDLISVRRRSGGIFLRESLLGSQIMVKNLFNTKAGDFIISKMQIVHGASALVTKQFEGAKISGSYITVIPRSSSLLNINYFNFYSRTPFFYHMTYISSYGVHIEKMTFNFESFLSLDIKIPSVMEQTAIAEVLTAADEAITKAKDRLVALKTQKRGLMQVLLTGKKRLV